MTKIRPKLSLWNHEGLSELNSQCRLWCCYLWLNSSTDYKTWKIVIKQDFFFKRKTLEQTKWCVLPKPRAWTNASIDGSVLFLSLKVSGNLNSKLQSLIDESLWGEKLIVGQYRPLNFVTSWVPHGKGFFNSRTDTLLCISFNLSLNCCGSKECLSSKNWKFATDLEMAIPHFSIKDLSEHFSCSSESTLLVIKRGFVSCLKKHRKQKRKTWRIGRQSMVCRTQWINWIFYQCNRIIEKNERKANLEKVWLKKNEYGQIFQKKKNMKTIYLLFLETKCHSNKKKELGLLKLPTCDLKESILLCLWSHLPPKYLCGYWNRSWELLLKRGGRCFCRNLQVCASQLQPLVNWRTFQLHQVLVQQIFCLLQLFSRHLCRKFPCQKQFLENSSFSLLHYYYWWEEEEKLESVDSWVEKNG